MKITLIAYEYGDVSIVTELLPHPILKSKNELFEDAFFFENAALVENEIIPGNSNILFYYTISEIDEKFISNGLEKYSGFSIIRKYYLKNENLYLLIAQK
jgi:hypothetical protein